MPCLSKILDKRGIPFNTQTNTPMTTRYKTNKSRTISTTGGYDPFDKVANLVVCYGGIHTITLDGLSRQDLLQIKSVINILLPSFTEKQPTPIHL